MDKAMLVMAMMTMMVYLIHKTVPRLMQVNGAPIDTLELARKIDATHKHHFASIEERTLDVKSQAARASRNGKGHRVAGFDTTSKLSSYSDSGAPAWFRPRTVRANLAANGTRCSVSLARIGPAMQANGAPIDIPELGRKIGATHKHHFASIDERAWGFESRTI